jgi:hypothetical protein
MMQYTQLGAASAKRDRPHARVTAGIRAADVGLTGCASYVR